MPVTAASKARGARPSRIGPTSIRQWRPVGAHSRSDQPAHRDLWRRDEIAVLPGSGPGLPGVAALSNRPANPTTERGGVGAAQSCLTPYTQPAAGAGGPWERRAVGRFSAWELAK